MGHQHGSGGHDHASTATRTRLVIALSITVGILVVEAIGAWLSGSLALLADAGHMASDAIGLAVALVASIIALRPPTDRHTFGFRRFEVLAALVNGVLLLVLAVTITIEGVRRLLEGGGETLGVPMLIVASIGLIANLVVLAVLRGGDRNSINLRGATLEVMGDALGSLAAIVAAIIILSTGFQAADAIASLLVAAFILPRAALLLRDVVRVLTESAPPGTSVAEIREHLLAAEGVVGVHDVHVWTITSGSPVFSAHVVVEPQVLEDEGVEDLLRRLDACLHEHFDVGHSTFQLEPAGYLEHEPHAHD